MKKRKDAGTMSLIFMSLFDAEVPAGPVGTANEVPTVGSMFAGVGGICLAFKRAGFRVEWANEIDHKACETYRANFPDHLLIEGDVTKICTADLPPVDVLVSGFPCQAFSIAGLGKGFDDIRGTMFFETARVVKALNPRAYLFENVENLMRHDFGRTFRVIRRTMQELGYSFLAFVLDASRHGNVPQHRARIFMVGFRDEVGAEDEADGRPGSLTSRFVIPGEIPLTKTLSDCLEDGEAGDRYYYAPDHYVSRAMAKHGAVRGQAYQWRRKYIRANKSGLCPTLTANMGGGGHNVPIIRDDRGYRKLTPRETFRLQGFPKDFVLPADLSDSALYHQAGNSVAVPVVERIATAMLNALTGGATETDAVNSVRFTGESIPAIYVSSASPLRYPGGKSRLAKTIVDVIEANIGERDLCSPFLGGASVELEAIRRGITVHGFDADIALYNFWDQLLTNKEAVVAEAEGLWDEYVNKVNHGALMAEEFPLRPDTYVRSMFHDLRRLVADYQRKVLARTAWLDARDAAEYWTLNRASFSGTGTQGGPSPDRFTRGAVEKLRSFRTDTKKFAVNLGHYYRVIREHPECFLYLDPPYDIPGQPYACKFSLPDHVLLCALLKGRGGWVLSYNDSPVVRAMYERFRIIKMDHVHCMGNWVKAKYGKANAGELLILADDIVYEDRATAA